MDEAIDESSGETSKPEIITFNNMTKGAVDVVDEMASAYSTARISKRWRVVVFFSLLNVATINSRILLLSVKEPPLKYKNRRHFLKDLALQLITSHAADREMEVLRHEESLRRNFADPGPSAKTQNVSCKKRCYLCARVKDRKTNSCCSKCYKNICKEHNHALCANCIE
ncbi:hypothetical protein JTE90_008294 [Oedothorax gibbosus]|uniref:PiggyBac transposable element-derived protein domain-containing protein n=1 Tax=Oedothorax gibbosus TaxID=931172 RepID=A0AAV6UH47_9ARAC|nr:hypothetical protein JTE90_008294 [Oedothorax gibbosus]